MHKQCYDSSWSVMTVMFSADVNFASSIINVIVEKESDIKFLRDCYDLVVLDCCHWYAALDILHKNRRTPLDCWPAQQKQYYKSRRIQHKGDWRHLTQWSLEDIVSGAPKILVIHQDYEVLTSYYGKIELEDNEKIVNASIKNILEKTVRCSQSTCRQERARRTLGIFGSSSCFWRTTSCFLSYRSSLWMSAMGRILGFSCWQHLFLLCPEWWSRTCGGSCRRPRQ